jgi:hypothetical protein
MHARLASRGDHRIRRILLASARAAFASAAGGGGSAGAGTGAPAQGGAGTGATAAAAAAAAAPQNANGAATVATRSFYRFNASESRAAEPPGDRNASASAAAATAAAAAPTAAGNVSGRIVGAYNISTAQRNVGGGSRSRFAAKNAPVRVAGTFDQMTHLMDTLYRVLKVSAISQRAM